MIRIQLSKLLGEKRLTQADIARMTGIRAGTINDLYHEIATRISLEHLDLLCEALLWILIHVWSQAGGCSSGPVS